MNMTRFLFFILLSLPFVCIAQPKKNGMDTIRSHLGMTFGRMKKGQKDGVWTRVDPWGKKMEETTYSKGVKQGASTVYFPGGTKVEWMRYYKNDKKEGTWYGFSTEGDTVKIENYLNDTLHGYCRTSSGEVVETCYYKHGALDGWVVESMQAEYLGNPVDSQYYSNGVLNGRSVLYAYGHPVKLQHYSNGKLHGAEMKFEKYSGNLLSVRYYKNGQPDSVYYEYDVSGRKLRTGYYMDGHAAKYDTLWDSDGQLIYVTDHTQHPRIIIHRWDNGVLSYTDYNANPDRKDSSVAYFSTGAIKRRTIYQYPEPQAGRPQRTRDGTSVVYTYYRNGVLQSKGDHNAYYRHGAYEEYDSLGRLTMKVNYSNGSRSGLCTLYYPSGAVQATVNFKSDKAQGRYLAYYADGKPQLSGTCRDGFVRDSVRVWTKTGAEAKKGTAQYDTLIAQHFREVRVVKYLDPKIVLPPPRTAGIEVDGVDGMAVEISDEPVESPDVAPVFPGGNDSLTTFLKRNLRYPAIAKEQAKEGTVFVQFIVEKDGSLTGVYVVKSVAGAPEFSQEAMRVVKSMPRWTPGKNYGQVVRVKYILPVKFTLR